MLMLSLLMILAIGVFILRYARLDSIQQCFSQATNEISHFFHKTFGPNSPEVIVFSPEYTAKELLQSLEIKLPYSFDLDKNIITIAQFINMPSKFEFRDETLGFELDMATLGKFLFRGDNQKFIELSLNTTNGYVKIEQGIFKIKMLIKKIDDAGWKRAAGFETAFVNLGEDSILKIIRQSKKSDTLGQEIMVWQSKNYQLVLRAPIVKEKFRGIHDEDKIYIEIDIKKIR